MGRSSGCRSSGSKEGGEALVAAIRYSALVDCCIFTLLVSVAAIAAAICYSERVLRRGALPSAARALQ